MLEETFAESASGGQNSQGDKESDDTADKTVQTMNDRNRRNANPQDVYNDTKRNGMSDTDHPNMDKRSSDRNKSMENPRIVLKDATSVANTNPPHLGRKPIDRISSSKDTSSSTNILTGSTNINQSRTDAETDSGESQSKCWVKDSLL